MPTEKISNTHVEGTKLDDSSNVEVNQLAEKESSDSGGGRINRRRALKGVAAGGAGAMLLPMVAPKSRSRQQVAELDGHGSHPARTPPVDEIPEDGLARNFELVSHVPLLDDNQFGDHEPLGIPRGSNGDITIAGDHVYVGSFIGHQPPVIVDVSDPSNPDVVGPVPDTVPGVGNGIEGIEASGDLLVIDQRRALGGLGFEVTDGLPSRGLAIYDVSDPRTPTLVARQDFGDLTTHTVSLWRDPMDPDRVLALVSFIDNPDLKVVDLTGCPDGDCSPNVVANWDLETQTPDHPEITGSTHEAIFSTDGQRIYVSQLQAGVFLIDSSNLIRTLQGTADSDCKSAAPRNTQGEADNKHCLTLLNPDITDREDTAPPLSGSWHHTPIKVPDRPYILDLSESTGPSWDQETEEILTANCPGALTRMTYVGEDAFRQDPDDGGSVMRGDLNPETVGVFGLPEQQLENCGEDGWKTGTANLPAWFSPHDAVIFPNIAFTTYYGAGFRAIDISDPFSPEEAGFFFNKPVEEVRWASYGIQGETVRREDGHAVRRPAPGPNHMFAFSYPVVHDGHIIYADVHSGLYILRYTGPHADEIPGDGNCLSGNPGAVEAGFEPCPPYGQTDWGSPGE